MSLSKPSRSAGRPRPPRFACRSRAAGRRGLRALLIAGVVFLAAAESPLAARVHYCGQEVAFFFEQDQQAHPKEFLIAVPVRHEMAGLSGGPLTIGGAYHSSVEEGDPRANRGKVILRITVLRDDEVIWRTKMRDRVRNDPDDWGDSTGTRHLEACDGFEGSLLPGDLVLFEFRFKSLPRFDAGEIAHLDVSVLPDCGD